MFAYILHREALLGKRLEAGEEAEGWRIEAGEEAGGWRLEEEAGRWRLEEEAGRWRLEEEAGRWMLGKRLDAGGWGREDNKEKEGFPGSAVVPTRINRISGEKRKYEKAVAATFPSSESSCYPRLDNKSPPPPFPKQPACGMM